MMSTIATVHIDTVIAREQAEIRRVASQSTTLQNALLNGFRLGWQLGNNEREKHEPLTKKQLDIFEDTCKSIHENCLFQLTLRGCSEGLQQRFMV